jgi:aspartate aminotransferase-like enzyme
MIRKPRLFTPGPTSLSPAVQEALGRPIVHHRTEEFRQLFRECVGGLQAFLKTREAVILLASSGTGAMEAALVNTLSPGDAMLALVAGNFAERWSQLGTAHGMQVRRLEAPWGEAVDPGAVERELLAHPELRAVFVQLSESSTGARHDVEALASIVRRQPDTLLVVDAISGAGAMPLEVDAWGVDVAIVGSQKALSLPPGLAFLSVSERAWQRIEGCCSPRFYFDLLKQRKSQPAGDAAFTPPISLVAAARAALAEVEALGGVDALVRNAATLAGMTRAAAQALELPLLAPRHAGDALTALRPPAGIEAGDVVKALKSEFGATVAGGQGQLKGQIFRIAHLGYNDVIDTLGLLGALELVLARLGHRSPPGAGVAAAQREYRQRVGMGEAAALAGAGAGVSR